MKKLLFCVLSAAFVSAACAAEPKKPLTDAEKAALREKRLQKTGGIIMKEGTGRVVIVNAQKKFPSADLERAVEPFRTMLKVDMPVREGEWKLGDKLPADANLAIYLVDDASLPMSLVAVESRWGVVNAAPLVGKTQLDREFMRVAILTLGAGGSQYKASPMQTVTKPTDLDGFVGTGITVDAGMAMKNNLKELGVTAPQMSTYRRACQEGWAAQPTNDYQRAIWKEIHELPSEPLKLTK